jgi:caffeoyl-CoA O-methyltransferase
MKKRTWLLTVAGMIAGTVGAQQGGPGRPGGKKGKGGSGGQPSVDASIFEENKPLPKDDEEKKILAVLDDMDKNQRQGNMNVPQEDGRLLRMFEESCGARNVVEIGTSSGYSSIWQCLALRKTGGHLTTFEIDQGRADMARANFKRAGVEKYVTLMFGDAHELVLEMKLDTQIDVMFLDADKEGYIDYLDKLMPQLRPGGLIIAHNMNPRQAHKPFVDAINKNPALETLYFHLQNAGISVTMKKR